MHLKRITAPDDYRQKKKELKFSTAVCPGPHKAEKSIPLAIVLRDILHYAAIGKEAKRIVSKREILVDAKPRTNHKYGVGFMDIISIPKTGEFFRVVIKDKKLILSRINKKEADLKICKITGKSKIKKGIVQLHFHDGRNISLDSKDKNVANYKVSDSLAISLPKQEIKQHLPLGKDACVMITEGKNKGIIGTVSLIKQSKGFKPDSYTVKTKDEEHITIKPYIFVIGKKEPLIDLE
ncbi:MAG: 30S ribosomal protein S4e [Candidatus Nanohalarchaeota archaeon]|nr:MAG: 30S ribosomal protein S4e [Candidatus Nanohaloarchaeota archaeon]